MKEFSARTAEGFLMVSEQMRLMPNPKKRGMAVHQCEIWGLNPSQAWRKAILMHEILEILQHLIWRIIHFCSAGFLSNEQ